MWKLGRFDNVEGNTCPLLLCTYVETLSNKICQAVSNASRFRMSTFPVADISTSKERFGYSMYIVFSAKILRSKVFKS